MKKSEDFKTLERYRKLANKSYTHWHYQNQIRAFLSILTIKKSRSKKIYLNEFDFDYEITDIHSILKGKKRIILTNIWICVRNNGLIRKEGFNIRIPHINPKIFYKIAKTDGFFRRYLEQDFNETIVDISNFSFVEPIRFNKTHSYEKWNLKFKD